VKNKIFKQLIVAGLAAVVIVICITLVRNNQSEKENSVNLAKTDKVPIISSNAIEETNKISQSTSNSGSLIEKQNPTVPEKTVQSSPVKDWRKEAGLPNEKVAKIDSQMRMLMFSLEQYRDAIGSYPVGDNTSIIQSLSGKNPKQMVFIEWLSQDTDSNGMFLDPWKNPYRLEVLQKDKVRITSAGPDRQFGTTDDEVAQNFKDNPASP